MYGSDPVWDFDAGVWERKKAYLYCMPHKLMVSELMMILLILIVLYRILK